VIHRLLQVVLVAALVGAPVATARLLRGETAASTEAGLGAASGAIVVRAGEGPGTPAASRRPAAGRTPFRHRTAQPQRRFGEAPLPVQPAPPPPAPRPVLVLSGIVWGPMPAAIIEGIPGRDQAATLAAGDSAGPVRVQRIEPSRVTVAGFDTVWVLEVRQPW